MFNCDQENPDLILSGTEFDSSGLVPADEIKEFGKMFGVDKIVMGKIRNGAGFHEIRIRVVDVETAEIVASSSVMMRRSVDLDDGLRKITKYSEAIYKGAFNLDVDSIKIKPKDENGRSWDALSRADICFMVFKGKDQIYRSEVYDDFPEIHPEISVLMELTGDETLFIYVYDKDVAKLQSIGVLELTPKEIRKLIIEGKASYACKNIDRIDLKIRKI